MKSTGSDEGEEKPAIECSMSYALFDENGRQIAAGDCKGTICKEYLTVYPKFGDILPFHLRDISLIDAENYRIILPMFSKEKLNLFNLGHCFEDFHRVLSDFRNEVIIKDLLMNETVREPDVNMEFTYIDDKGNEKQKGPGKVRLYETAMVIIPQNGEFLRVPFSEVISLSEENYGIKVGTEYGGQFLLDKMGPEFSPFLRQFSDINNELQTKAVSSLKALYPPIDSLSLRRVAAIMKEGKAAKRADIEAINPKLWPELEKKITSSGLNDSYTFLKELGRQEKMAIGFKQGLMGDLTGEYIWFLVPIYGNVEKGYGNAVAMEATEASGEESTGKATYFFKLVSRLGFPTLKIPDQLDAEVDKLLKTINRCMLNINFRREPIYIPEEKLDEPDYVKYRIALQKIPSLQLLRNLYIGRVVHASQEQWKNDVMELLKFNATTQDDSSKWKKQ
jgi:hypothetical protein